MPKPTLWKDEYTLLCEKCGYVVEGLDTAGNCPECGKPIEESLPERRTGTPWQQRPWAGSFILTLWLTLTHPNKTLDRMVFHLPHKSSRLRIVTNLSASGALFLPWILLAAFRTVKRWDGDLDAIGWLTLGLLVGIALCIVAWGILELLTLIEFLGLQFFGQRRQHRITPRIARVICAHGAVGWLIGALGFNLAVVLLISAAGLGIDVPRVLVRAPVAMLLVGFVIFEFFAYLGLRRLKYANTVRPVDSYDPTP